MIGIMYAVHARLRMAENSRMRGCACTAAHGRKLAYELLRYHQCAVLTLVVATRTHSVTHTNTQLQHLHTDSIFKAGETAHNTNDP